MTIFRRSESEYKIGLIGYGAIGHKVADAIMDGEAGFCRLVAVLRQSDDTAIADFMMTNDQQLFFSQNFDLVIEAAGHQAVKQYAEPTFAQHADFLVTSIGVLADEELQKSLIKSAGNNKVRILLASGALPAVDWMSAVAQGTSCKVSIIQEKPVTSWRGTPAETLIDLDNISSAQCFFEGTARESASQFPQSSNITAMLALSTAGLDATDVKLVADPLAEKMRTLISFESELGQLEVTWHGLPSQSNSRTSVDVAFTVIKALRNLTSSMVSGV